MIFTIYSLSSLIAFLTAFICGLIVFLHNKKNSINITYFLLSITITIWVSGCFLESTLISYNLNKWVDIYLYSGAAFAPIFFFHAILEVTKQRTNKFNRIYLKTGYFISFFFFIINLFYRNIFIWGIDHRLSFRYIAIPGPFWYLYILFFIVVTTYALIVLYGVTLKARTLEKNKFIYLSIAYTTVILAACFYLLLVFNIETPPIDNFLVVIYSLLMVYAITKVDLMDIRLVIKKIPSIVIISIIVFFSLAFTIYFTITNFILCLFLASFLGLFWAFFAKPFQEFLITRAKRKFIKGYYDADLVFKNISKKLAKENDRSKMFRAVAQVFDKQMQFEKIATFIAIRDKDKINKYVLIEKDFEKNQTLVDESFDLDNEVIKLLTKQITPFYLKDTEKEMQKFFVGYGFPKNTFCLPFASLDGLEGMIILGERSCGKVLKESELELFNTIISHVSALLYKYTSVEKVRKQFEANQKQLYETEVQLVRAEKIASLVRTTQECQHEIRTPINAIKLWLDGLSEHPSTEEIEEFRKVAVKHINRLLYVVESSLSLGSNKEKKLTKLNINEVIEEATDLIPPSGYSLVKKLETVPDILGVKAELITVFLNFINNAKQAMEKSGGNLTVKSFFDENSQNVIIKIIDTGVGIASENLERIWEPYFTTDKTYGHGLGLSIVHQIVQSYKGIVQVESVLKKGTTFTLKFPTAK